MSNECTTFINNLNIYNGNITYNSFEIDENLPFDQQVYSYRDDLLQIEFGPRYTLDVGYYPEMDPEGHFWVRGIKDYDWDCPVIQKKCRSFAALKKAIEKIAKFLSDENQKQEVNKRKTFVDDLNICNGHVVYNEFDIDENIPFDRQKNVPQKDALFIEFGQSHILHVGWVKEFGSKGYFLVQGIEGHQWHNPVSQKKCRSLQSLKKAIEKTAQLLLQENKKHVERMRALYP